MTAGAVGTPPVVAPLAPLQRSMLAATLAANPGELYVTQAVFALSETMDHARWSRVWQQLADRHEALRSIFVTDRPGEPVQVFLESVDLPLRQVDVDSSEALEQMLDAERCEPFEFDRAPLLRLTLIRRSDAKDLHVMTFHHALLDGWSVELLMEEALALYAGRILDSPPPFRRYLGWYHGQRSECETYWKDVLTDFPAPVHLPGDSADNGDGVQREVVEHALTSETSARLKRLCETHALTQNAVLGALWFALIARISGESDVTVGMVSAGRDAPVADIQRIVGLVMNAVPVRVVVDSEQSTLALASRVQRAVTGAAAHSHLPLHAMLKSAGLAEAESPYDTMLVFEQVPEPNGDVSGPAIESRRYIDRSSLPLSLLVFPSEHSLTFRFQFNASRYSREMIESLARAYVAGIEEFNDLPEEALSALEFGAPAVSDAPATVSSTRVIERIANNLATLADAPAITVGAQTQSWSSLHNSVSRVVGALQKRNAPTGAPVLVKLRPGADAIAVVLGAMFCGRPYVYLDPAYPSAHHDRVIDVVARVFGDDFDVISDDTDQQTLSLADVMQSERTSLPSAPSPDALAYIVFTSGSTGVPKGVKVSHANLDYSNAARHDVYGDGPERFLLLSSLAFDSSVAGLFWTLAHGGELVLPEKPLGESLDLTAALVSNHGITHTLCLPSVYRVMLNAASGGELDTLRCVIVAGEACDLSLPELHTSKGVGAQLHNEYGPSEATVWCASARLDGARSGAISVGRPPAGTSLYVQSTRGERLADGLIGELVVSGPGVAVGYLDTEDNAEDEDVFFDGPAGRSYATGDLATLRDGEVCLSGRLDDQLKVNGVRVELADVERHVGELAQVHDAVVVDFETGDGRTQLAAHVLPEPSLNVAGLDPQGRMTSALRDSMKDRVPAALVPARFVIHAQFPRLPNGKLDRNALRRASTQAPAEIASGDVNAPATIRALMHKVTGVAPASDSDSFFDLGGDSLAAVNLVDHINTHFGVSINVANVYESPTPQALGQVVNADAGRDDWLAITPINTSGTTLPLYFAYGNAAVISRHLGADVPLYWVVHGRHGIVYPTDSFEALAAAHYAQLRAQQPSGPYCLAGFSIGAIVVTEIARLLREAGESVPMLVLIDPTSPAKYVHHGGPARAMAFMRSRGSVGAKLRFFVGRMRDRFIAQSEHAHDEQTLAGMTLHANSDVSRETLINEVSCRLASHPFRVCPGDATLMRPAIAGPGAAHSEYDRLVWSDLFAGTVDDVLLDVDSQHTELFADDAAMASVAKHLRGTLDSAGR